MEPDVVCLDQENQSGDEEQPERGGNSVKMNDPGSGWGFMQVVVEVETEAGAHDDPEGYEPEEGGPAIVARRPG
jgi:hypothetical protein